MRKFDNYYKLLREATPPPAPDEEEDDTGNINFDEEDGMGDGEDMADMDQDLPIEGEDELAPAEAQSQQVSTPAEYELSKLVLKAIKASDEGINPKIYSDFEANRNSQQILNYLGTKLRDENIDSAIDGIISTLSEDGSVDPSQVQGKNISDKLAYYNQNTEDGGMQDVDLDYWTRIILNALKYDGNDYDTGGNLTPEGINAAVSKMKSDFNYDAEGMFDKFVKDRVTGSNFKGPGVF